MSRARLPWWLPVAATLGAWTVRLLGATWRFEVSDAPGYAAARARGERFVYAFWHAGLLSLAVLHRGEGVAVLVSRHRDGELIARIIERLGYVTARGSSTRGGEAGVREMLAWADDGRDLAITPDGPRGPAERAKEGLAYLAERTRLGVVPIAVVPRSAWWLKSWDRFGVPRPFTRVRIAHGDPLVFETGGEGAAERACRAFEAALATLTRETRGGAGGRA